MITEQRGEGGRTHWGEAVAEGRKEGKSEKMGKEGRRGFAGGTLSDRREITGGRREGGPLYEGVTALGKKPMEIYQKQGE